MTLKTKYRCGIYTLFMLTFLTASIHFIITFHSTDNANQFRTTLEIRADPVVLTSVWQRESIHPSILTEEQWRTIESKLVPNRPMAGISQLLHQLENWGPTYQAINFESTLSGPRMMRILLLGQPDALYLPRAPMLYNDSNGQARISRYDTFDSESHPHQVLATCAALGISRDQIMKNGSYSVTIGDLVETMMGDCQLTGEIEWTAIALARYAPTNRKWTNRWNNIICFDNIAEHLLAKDLAQGSCAGTHTLIALASMLQVDKIHQLFTIDVRNRIVDHLNSVVNKLKETQRPDGFWPPDWHIRIADPYYYILESNLYDQSALVLATGHHLEWLQLFADEESIGVERIQRSLDWCSQKLLNASDIQETDQLCPYSHCFRSVRRFSGMRHYTPFHEIAK